MKIADRQWRYSRSRNCRCLAAPRETRIESLHAERETLSERLQPCRLMCRKVSV
ncbi:hypothetical protein ACNKHS_05425 [Shigella flexneri]